MQNLVSKMIKEIIGIIEFFQDYFNFKLLEIIKKVFLGIKADVIIIIEGEKWVIGWIGRCISSFFKKYNLIDVEIASPFLTRNKIIHFSSINCLLNLKGMNLLKKSNKFILTWYHSREIDRKLNVIPIINEKIDSIITPSVITKHELVKLGLKKEKISIVPLGIDLNSFHRFSVNKRVELKKKFNIPNNKFIIGSFQKDGIGWGSGLEPKLIKGPDVFCEVVRKINKNFDIHVFLTGPARGYVKKRLKEYDISYTHIYLNNYLDIVECYNVLDLYIITSRIEGGPMGLLEGMATGVPLITTNVGMVSEIIKNGFNGFITDVDSIDQLYKYSIKLIENKELRETFIKNGLKIIKSYRWENILKKYYINLYKNLLTK